MQFFAVCKAAAMSLTRHHDKSVSRCWWLDGLDQPHRLWLGQKKKSEIWTSVRKDRDKVWWRERDTKICQRCAWRDGQEVITGTYKEVRMSNSEMMETHDHSEEKGVAPPPPPPPRQRCSSASHSKVLLKGLGRHTCTQAAANTPLRGIRAGIGTH